MTTHADRDRSERPWWPPAAPAAYAHDIDEPVPFILTDEPQGELLPVAPEGIVLQCQTCPATLADTRGGRLVHHDDGTHTFEPSATDGCDCAELCEMGPTCPGGMLAGLPGSGCHRTAIDPELYALRTVVESAIPALRSEAKGLRVDTFLRPANAPTAAVLESVADLLAAAVEP